MNGIKQDLRGARKSFALLKNENELLAVISMSFIVMLIGAFLLTLIGVIDLRIVSEINIPLYWQYIICFVMYSINIIALFHFAFIKLDKRLWSLLLLFVIACQIIAYTSIINVIFISSGLFANIFILIVTLLTQEKYKYKAIFLRHTVCLILCFTFNRLSNYIKFDIIELDIYQGNILPKLIYSIDLYLFYIFLYWVVKNNYVTLESILRLFQFLKSTCKKILSNRQMVDVSDLTARQRHVYVLLTWGYLFFQSAVIIGTTAFINKMFYHLGDFYIGVIELFIAWTVLEACRLALGKTLHYNNPIKCTIVSFGAFYIISRFALPFHISLFFNICIVAIMAAIIHIYVIKFERYDDMENYLIKSSIPPPFKCRTATEDEIRKRSKAKGIKSRYADILVFYYIDELDISVIGDKVHLSYGTIENYIKKYRKLIESE